MDNQTVSRGISLARCVGAWIILSTGCADEGDEPIDLSFRTIVYVPPPSGNCATDQQNLQNALDSGGTLQVNIPAGAYCIEAPLEIRSNTVVSGAGSGSDPAVDTIITQQNTATSGFHMNAISTSTLQDLRVVLQGDLSAMPPGSSCVPNPVTPSLCMWQRGSGVAIYGSSNITIARNTFVSGTYGVALLDHEILEAPAGGPLSQITYDVSGRPEVWDDRCHDGDLNSDISVVGNTVVGAQDGIYVLNLSSGVIRDNTVSGSPEFNGIKMGCGPIKSNRIVGNYLFGNGLDPGARGDGLDVAWTWSETDEGWGWSIGDPPDGLFRGNTVASNLSWGNGGNGIAIKSSQYTTPTPKRGITAYFCGAPGEYDLTTLMRIGDNQIDHNAAWSNGLSQFVLRRSVTSGGCWAQRLPEWTPVNDNVWRADPNDPADGMELGHVRYVKAERNWAEGSQIGGNARDYYFFHPSIHFVTMPGNYGDLADVASVTGVTFGPGKDIEDFLETLTDATPARYDEAMAAILASEPYHCADDDGDLCPNACEALAGTDHLDASSTPAICDCPGQACS